MKEITFIYGYRLDPTESLSTELHFDPEDCKRDLVYFLSGTLLVERNDPDWSHYKAVIDDMQKQDVDTQLQRLIELTPKFSNVIIEKLKTEVVTDRSLSPEGSPIRTKFKELGSRYGVVFNRTQVVSNFVYTSLAECIDMLIASMIRYKILYLSENSNILPQIENILLRYPGHNEEDLLQRCERITTLLSDTPFGIKRFTVEY